MDKKLVVVPCFNEVETLPAVLKAVMENHHGRILVVDDGSTDGSIERSRALVALPFEVVTHHENLGYGASLITGFQYALEEGVEHVVTVDCDSQHEPTCIPQFFEKLQEGIDVVSGSRYLDGSEIVGVAAPEDRRKINHRITSQINSLTGWALTDGFCGFKGYSRNALESFALTETGYGFPLQLWVQAFRAKLRVAEIPVPRVYLNISRTFGLELDDSSTKMHQFWIHNSVICWHCSFCQICFHII